MESQQMEGEELSSSEVAVVGTLLLDQAMVEMTTDDLSHQPSEPTPLSASPSRLDATAEAKGNARSQQRRKRGESVHSPHETGAEDGTAKKRIKPSTEHAETKSDTGSAEETAKTSADDDSAQQTVIAPLGGNPLSAPQTTSQSTNDDGSSAITGDESKNIAVSAAVPSTKKTPKSQKRWRVHQMAEDYIELASNMMLFPTTQLGPYGYPDNNHQGNGERQNYPLELMSSLGFLKSPLRRPTIIEKWSPYDISLFEAGIGHYGKDFYQIHKLIQTKSTKEVIDFYYIWKKTSHYKVWKKQHVAPGEVVPDEDYASTPIKKPTR